MPGVDWELVELLGAGGFGEVWKARNPYMSSVAPVALKFCLDAAVAHTLRHEAAVLNRVMHQGKDPGIVPLLHTYLAADPPCLEYEFVGGGDLASLIRDRRSRGWPVRQATEVARYLAKVVGKAHRLSPAIVHRDLKPANILVQRTADGKLTFRITDFGIGGLVAKQAIEESTRAGTVGSLFLATALHGSYTPLYASPQQMQGGPPDPRDDVYALGVIWYQLMTGNLATGKPGGGKWRSKLAEQGLTTEMADLLESCFEDDPSDRPADAATLAETLTKLLAPAVAKAVVASSQNPAVYGEAVTFTATVAPVPPATGSPSGAVAFMEGTTILRRETLGSGTATLTTSSLAAGSHGITVKYEGDTAFPTSTSPPLTQSVTPAPLTVKANDASKVCGQDNPTFTVTCGGFVNGETAEALAGTLTFNTPATADSPAGSYAITPGGLTSNNYRITFAPGTLAVQGDDVPPDWKAALASVTNAALVAFYKKQLAAGRENYLPKRYLHYRIAGKRRWNIQAHRGAAYAWQKGRFEGDIDFWRGGLNQPEQVKPVKEGGCLSFSLSTEQDFQFFHLAATEKLVSANWQGGKQAPPDPPIIGPVGGGNPGDPRLPPVGSQIVKEYKGKTYTVAVTANGFEMGKEHYTSLTAVAKAIRASKGEVSGFAFFGLGSKPPGGTKEPVDRDRFGSRLGSNKAKANAVLTTEPKAMAQIVQEAGLPATMYNHLNRLASKGLVVKTKEGYRLRRNTESLAVRKKGLRAAQIRILEALAKAKEPLNKHRLVELANVTDASWVIEYLGHPGMECGYIMRGGKPTSVQKLIPAGLVKQIDKDIGGKTEKSYEITDAGREALAAPVTDKTGKPAAVETGKILRPQIRILAALASAKEGRLTKAGIIAEANIPPTWVIEYLGHDGEMVSDMVRGARKLVPAGLVKIKTVDGKDEKLYEITDAGRKALTAASPTEPQGEQGSGTLADLIAAGVLTPPLKLFRNYKGKRLEASLLADGAVEFQGKRYDTCSGAAEAARAAVSGHRMNTNGWVFWQYQSADGKKLLLRDARQQLVSLHGEDASGQKGPQAQTPERYALRLKFWQELLNRPKAKNTRHANLTVSGEYHYIGAGSGVRGVPFNYVIRQDEGTVELYIDRGAGMTAENKDIFDRLHRHKEEIEKTFGGGLSWQRLDDKQACRIACNMTAGGYRSEESKWPAIQDAMIDAMSRLEKALAPHLAKL